MTDRLRRAGRGRTPADLIVVWSVAAGERGRRWRWTVADGGRLRASALVELRPDGRFARLELATAAGLLTFHPEPDGASAHGNIVTADAVRPIAVAWQPEWGIGFEDDPFGSAVGGWPGEGLGIGPDLRWRTGAADIETLALDVRGVPILADAAEWALEA